MLEAARDGKLGVLALLGVNPVLHWPDRQLALDALNAAPFVVVSELFMTETAELATLVLPACSAFEKIRHDDQPRRRRAAGGGRCARARRSAGPTATCSWRWPKRWAWRFPAAR